MVSAMAREESIGPKRTSAICAAMRKTPIVTARRRSPRMPARACGRATQLRDPPAVRSRPGRQAVAMPRTTARSGRRSGTSKASIRPRRDAPAACRCRPRRADAATPTGNIPVPAQPLTRRSQRLRGRRSATASRLHRAIRASYRDSPRASSTRAKRPGVSISSGRYAG